MMNVITVIIPRHVSAKIQTSFETAVDDNDNNHVPKTTIVWNTLFCYKSNIAWQALFPIIFKAPKKVSKLFLQQLMLPNNDVTDNEKVVHCNNTNPTSKTTRSTLRIISFDKSNFLQRNFHWNWTNMKITNTNLSIIIYIQPFSLTKYNNTFELYLQKMVNYQIKLQTLSAYYSSLGGGYFYCKKLHHALQLSQLQYQIAKQLQHESMQWQSKLHMAYNLIYAGKFTIAKLQLQQLTIQLQQKQKHNGNNNNKNHHHHRNENDAASTMLAQVQAAMSLLCKMYAVTTQTSATLNTIEYYRYMQPESSTVDDYQRIRVVEV